MSKHHNPARHSMMPAPVQVNPEPARDESPMLRAYCLHRVTEGWEQRILMLPRDVVERYAVKTMSADVLPIVIAKVAMDIERIAEGRAGAEHG